MHAQMAVGLAIESKEPVAHVLCHFNSPSLKRHADVTLCDLIGFEPFDSLPGWNGYIYPQLAIFERKISIQEM